MHAISSVTAGARERAWSRLSRSRCVRENVILTGCAYCILVPNGPCTQQSTHHITRSSRSDSTPRPSHNGAPLYVMAKHARLRRHETTCKATHARRPPSARRRALRAGGPSRQPNSTEPWPLQSRAGHLTPSTSAGSWPRGRRRNRTADAYLRVAARKRLCAVRRAQRSPCLGSPRSGFLAMHIERHAVALATK